MSMLRRDRLVNTSAPLEDGFSLYLDLVRFLAAMCVFIGHATESGSLYVGYLPFGNFKHDAVIIFFVLSGLVICATATRPGETWITYLTARASRIYSVAIPAVALSFGLQAIAAFLEPGHSQPEPSADVFLPLSALLFILQSWHPQALPWNGPYWSLCYEVWYYIIFGILLFVRNPGRRNAVAACAALIAGPAILLLFPIWLMGVWIAQRPRFSLGPKSINFIIFFGTFGAVAILDHLDIAIRTPVFFSRTYSRVLAVALFRALFDGLCGRASGNVKFHGFLRSSGTLLCRPSIGGEDHSFFCRIYVFFVFVSLPDDTFLRTILSE